MRQTKILIVEDEAIVALQIQKQLEQRGYHVTGIHGSGEEALQEVALSPPDLVLMDITLQGKMNGIETAERIAASHDIPVIFLTAHSEDRTVEKAKTASPHGYILKPVSAHELNIAVQMALYKHAQDRRLKEMERWLSAILRSSGDAVIATDKVGRVVFMNPRAEKYTGWLRNEAVGKRIGEVITGLSEKLDRLPLEERIFTDVLQNGEEARLCDNALLVNRDGDRLPVDGGAAPIRDDHGRITGVVMTFRDITERKQTEMQLQARLRLIDHAESHPLGDLLQKTLDEVCGLTGSAIGFYHFLEEDEQTLSLQAWSTRTLLEFCKASGKDLHYPVSQAGVWVDCIRLRKPVIHNDYASLPHRRGMPEGHARVVRELAVPIFRENRIVAVLGVGNKETDYTEKDKEAVCYLADVAWEIVRRKQTEESLMESERRTRALTDSAQDAIVMMDPVGLITYWNPAAERIFGHARQEALGRDLHRLIVPERYRQAHDNGFHAFRETGKGDAIGKTLDLEALRKDGREISVQLSLSAIKMNDGWHAVGVIRDITDQKRMSDIQAFLAMTVDGPTSEPFFHAMADFLATTLEMDLVCIEALDDDAMSARTLAVWREGGFSDNGAYRLKDTPRALTLKKGVHVIPQGVRAAFPDDKVLEGLQAECYAGKTLFGHDGRPVGLVTMVGRSPSSNPEFLQAALGVVAVRAAAEIERMAADAALKQAHESLEQRVAERTADLEKANRSIREEEERFRTVANFTYDWEYWISPEGRIRYMSPSCERVTGYTAEEFMQRPELLKLVTHPEDIGIFCNHVDIQDASSAACWIDFRIVAKSGDIRWMNHVCQAVTGSDGTYLGRRVSNRDITDRKQAEEERERLSANLRQHEKMAVVGQLAGGMAHDLNNRLAVVLSSVDLVDMKFNLTGEMAQHCAEIRESARQGANLIRQLMAFSRKGQQAKTPMDLCDILRRMQELLARTFDRMIQISLDCPEFPVVIIGDATQIQNALMNLAVNARDAMPNGGELSFSLSRVDLDTAFCRTRPDLRPGPHARLTVKDTGEGMTPEVRDRIFEPFFTTKPEGKGTGLGLAGVFGTIQNHQGHVEVETAPGKGTAFVVFFPLASPSSVPRHIFGKDEKISGQGRLLIVDDEAVIRTLMSESLSRLGYEVTAVPDGREAASYYQKNHERIDLVILDMVMPFMSGWDVWREMRTIRPDARALFVTGYAEPELIEKAKAEGVTGFLRKPFSIAALSQAVAAAVKDDG